MSLYGFSTGALSAGDFRQGIAVQRISGVGAIELSALRESELLPLLKAFSQLDLQGFEYISFHAPSKIRKYTEQDIVTMIDEYLPAEIPIIVHPDAITQFDFWAKLGKQLCIENMDRRKSGGRTVPELEAYFKKLPEASFCFDIAHARHVDTSMSLAVALLWEFGNRLMQVHISEVNDSASHIKLSDTAIAAYRRVVPLIPQTIPIIIESVIPTDCIECELESVKRCFSTSNASSDYTAMNI